MHFMPEDEGYEEKLWPDGYKTVIREKLHPVIASELQSHETINTVHAQQYADRFAGLERFRERIVEMLAIGAEKGADEALDDVVTAFLYESPLPEPRAYTRYLLFSRFPEEVEQLLMQTVSDEYRPDEVYVHAFTVGYYDLYETYDDFVVASARLVVVGAINGLEDMMTAIYRAFSTGDPLPPARRNAKRIKNWFVPKGSKKRDVPLSRRAQQKRR